MSFIRSIGFVPLFLHSLTRYSVTQLSHLDGGGGVKCYVKYVAKVVGFINHVLIFCRLDTSRPACFDLFNEEEVIATSLRPSDNFYRII